MSDNKPPIPRFEVSDEQLARISGGDCTPQELIDVFDQLKDSYETLIDFTSYVIERVVTASTN